MGKSKVIVEWNDKGEKKCQTCEEFKAPELFHYKTKCEDCYLAYQAEYREKHREELAERKRLMRAQQRKGKNATRKIRDLKALKIDLETKLLNDPECRFCSESDNRALRFMHENSAYTLDEAMGKFRNDTPLELICLNCDAKQLHALPLF